MKETIYDRIGNPCDVGDYMEFDSKGRTIISEIIDLDGSCFVAKPIGFRHAFGMSQDEIDEVWNTLQNKYYINTNVRIFFKVNISKNGQRNNQANS